MATNLLMMGTDNGTTWIVYNELVAQFGSFPIIIEKNVSRRSLLRLRIQRLGLSAVLGQLGFLFLIRPILRLKSQRRMLLLCRRHGLEPMPPVSPDIHHVTSVNSEECRALLKQFQPGVIVVNGTRIIGKKTLGAVNSTFINTHQGITPRYRGAHGAYWALLEGRQSECGVTIHLVDEGIDTGNIIVQAQIKPEREDNFITYPLLQTAAALEHIVGAVKAAWAGAVKSQPIPGEGLIWYHPGFFQYLRGAARGIW